MLKLLWFTPRHTGNHNKETFLIQKTKIGTFSQNDSPTWIFFMHVKVAEQHVDIIFYGIYSKSQVSISVIRQS